jgi:wyosine [tRNA(Phe)-imidazoG37] synthetase (radical SAM superfamily)
MRKEYLIDNKITSEFVDDYTKTTYRIVGENKHSAIKPCYWLEQRLMTGRNNRNCYKGIFGVESHRCLQNTPSLPFCNHQCVFCWRDTDIGNLASEFVISPDEPKILIKEMLRHQKDIIKNHLPLRRYLDNYEIMIDILNLLLVSDESQSVNSLSKTIHTSKNKIDRAIILLKNQEFVKTIDKNHTKFKICEDIANSIETRDEVETLINRALTSPDDIMQSHSEALRPNHAAISLDGEPMLYPNISEFIREFRNRNMTTFVVTNGTLPKKLENLESLPSQLYITLPAPSKKMYQKTCRPMIDKGWEKLMGSISLIESLSCRSLIRLTAVKDLNINEDLLNNYHKIIQKGNPDFFEIKGFTLQARALEINKRLKSEKSVKYYFPDYDYLHELALRFQEISGYPLIYENKASRDFLFAVKWNEKKDPIIKNP